MEKTKSKHIRYSHLKFSLCHVVTVPIGPGPPHHRGFTIIINYTPQSVGLLWTNNQFDAETSTCTTHNTHDRHPCPPGGIRTRNPSKRAAAEPLIRPRGHWDRHKIIQYNKHIIVQIIQQSLYQMSRLVAEQYVLFCYSRGAKIFKISRNR